MFTYNIGFKDSKGFESETQLDANDITELKLLIETLKDEMDIREITYIELTTEEEV